MRYLLVDDEPLALEALKLAMGRADPQAELYGFTLPSKAVEFAGAQQLDAAFLDIELGSVNGLTLAMRLKELQPDLHIIFVTSYDQYAVDAFQIHASGYLLKPVTEAAILSGLPYQENNDINYVNHLLDGLHHPCAVLTGVDFAEGGIGVVLREGTVQQEYRHKRVGKGCHGTGDIFAAVFTGALMQGKNRLDAAKIAADFTCRCIENTVNAPAHWYGVKFEPLLPELMEMLGQ